MLTIKAEVLKKDLRVDGTYNVKIRFTYKREVKVPTSESEEIITANANDRHTDWTGSKGLLQR